MRIGLLIVAGLALIGFLVVAVALPHMQETEAKDAAQALIAGAEPAKRQVGAVAEKSGKVSLSGPIKLASRIDPKHGEMKWIASDDGVVHGWNEQNAIEITLMPSLQGGKTSWMCKGYPMDAMPPSCGGH